MTYKSAVAGINLGGGKSVIIGDNKRRRPRGAVPGPRPVRRDAGRPLHHGRGHRDQPGGHGVHQARDRPRGRPRSACSGDPSPVTAYGVYVGHEGGGQGALGQRQPHGQDGGGAGLRQGRALTCAGTCTRRAPSSIVTDIDRGQGAAGRERDRRHRGGPGRDLRPGGRRLRAVRARRHDQRRHAARGSRSRSSPAAPTTSSPRTATATCSSSGASSTRRTTSSTAAA